MKSKIYRDLSQKKVSEVTVDELDVYRQEFYAQGRKNISEYNDLNLMALTSNQNSVRGNIPGTANVSRATGIYDAKTDLFQPSTGTWSVQYISFDETGGSGTYTHEVYLEVKGFSMLIASSTDSHFKIDLEIDNLVVVQVRTIGGGGTPTLAGATAYYMRCR